MEEINYDVMRYDLDDDGYILNIYFGCSSGTCKGYTGTIPDGYDSIEDWATNANIRAYRVVEDNLVFDAARCSQIENKCAKEAEENRLVRYKEIKNITSIYKQDLYEMYKTSESEEAQLVELTDANRFEAIKIHIKNISKTITGKLVIKSSNANMLPNEATSKEESGISFAGNEDKSITLNGTATANIEYLIAGTSTNTIPLLNLKKNLDYFLSSDGYTIKMYHYDGIDRTQVYSGTGAIKFTDDDKNVTQIVLIIPKGKVINNETIYLMLNKGTTAEPYIMHDSNEAIIDLGEYSFAYGDNIEIEDGQATLYKEIYPNSSLFPSPNLYPRGTAYDLGDINNMPLTYKEKSYLYVCADALISMKYPNTTQNLEYENTSSKNGGFSVDEEGNASIANGAVKINKQGIQMADGTEIVGATGVFSIFEFDGEVTGYNPVRNGQYQSLGADYVYELDAVETERMILDAYIPENFTIKKAYIHFSHYPIDAIWQNKSIGAGYCRELKLYKANAESMETKYLIGSEYLHTYEDEASEEITNAFGVSSYTPSSSGLSDIETIDIANELTTGKNRLIIKSDATMPTGDDETIMKQCALRTGMVQATLVVLGFSK